MKIKSILLTISALLVATFTAPAHALLIDNFDGTGASSINGTTPDTYEPGSATWTAAANFLDDGVMSAAGTYAGSILLPFNLSAGNTYTLDGTLSMTSTTATHWAGFAFGKTSTTAGIVNANTYAGLFIRGSGTGFTDTDGIGGTPAIGSGLSTSNLNFDILIDTTDTQWTVTYTLAEGTINEVSQVQNLPTFTNDLYLQIGKFGDANVDVSNVTVVPEPTALTLLPAALFGMVFYRRSRRE